MSDIKLFHLQGNNVTELTGSAAKIEKSLQEQIEKNPDELNSEEDFTRDVRNVGHYGTGDLEITIHNQEDLVKAEPLILKSYE
ncbi:MAG: hypothetical protein ACFCU6_12775, partial [Balneolaceae bacterium]